MVLPPLLLKAIGSVAILVGRTIAYFIYVLLKNNLSIEENNFGLNKIIAVSL